MKRRKTQHPNLLQSAPGMEFELESFSGFPQNQTFKCSEYHQKKALLLGISKQNFQEDDARRSLLTRK